MKIKRIHHKIKYTWNGYYKNTTNVGDCSISKFLEKRLLFESVIKCKRGYISKIKCRHAFTVYLRNKGDILKVSVNKMLINGSIIMTEKKKKSILHNIFAHIDIFRKAIKKMVSSGSRQWKLSPCITASIVSGWVISFRAPVVDCSRRASHAADTESRKMHYLHRTP